MKQKLIAVFLILIFSVPSVLAQEINTKMREVYKAFKELQPYMENVSKFEDSSNDKAIKALLGKLQESFHTADKLGTRYTDLPAFIVNLNHVSDMITDSNNRFKEGKKSYAFWRIRNLSSQCFACHTTYSPKISFESDNKDADKLSPVQKADFYISTRQYSKALDALNAALDKNENEDKSFSILEKWLVVQIRSNISPADTAQKLSLMLDKLDLPAYEKEQAERWVVSLNDWSKEKPETVSLESAEKMIKSAVPEDLFEVSSNQVQLIRATGALHGFIEDKELSGDDRAKALYMLGLAYNELKGFFVDDMSEIYLELCIEEFPGTRYAKTAYKLYDDIVSLDFTGSGGTHLPGDVKLKMIELHKKAYSIPGEPGKV